MPFAALHHAEVLIESEFPHGIECEPVHNFVDYDWFFCDS